MNEHEIPIDHEVRIRLLEKIAASLEKRFELVDRRFEHLENKIDSQFKWTIGIMITMFGGILLTKLF
jgi:hypothetical protein